MSSDQPIRWGIIGPGTIARTFADGIAHSRTGKLAAIATRNPDKPGLADNFPGARIVNGYEALAEGQRDRRRLYLRAAYRPCRMGNQGNPRR
jgi:predicted dehydrogenase